ncbi:MAG TPA: hypothetical protein VLQ79_03525, partial [Myxococcaceae bacterium]|nr:hypothetical protein [Myxococcaceae bacterium]
MGPLITPPRPAHEPARRRPLRVLGVVLLALLPFGASAQPLLGRAEPTSSPVEPILRLAAEQRYDDDVLLTQ